MEQNDLNKRFFTGADLPVPVPSTDLAWEQMQNRLDKEMPQKGKRKKRFFIFFLLLALLTGPVIFFHPDNDNKNTQTGLNETVSEKNTDKVKDVTSIPVINNSPDKKEHEKLQGQKNINNPISDDNKASTETQNLSARKDDKLMSASKRNKIRGGAAMPAAETNYTNNRNKKANLHSNNKRETDKQQNILPDGPGSNAVNKPAVIISEKNITTAITAPTISQDSSIVLEDKNNSAQINKTTDSLDIAVSTEPEEQEPVEEKIIFKSGLQWNIQIPTVGASHYFTGSNLKSQPYLLLIPGIWTSLQINRSLFSLEVNPYYTSLIPSKTYWEFTSPGSIPDTISIVTERRHLNKLIGTAFSASFGYNIKGNWWLKGGLQMQWWRKGIGTASISEEKYPVNNMAAKTFSSSTHLFPVENSEWNYFTKFQVNPNIETICMFNKLEASLRIGLPVAPITHSGNGPKNSIRTEFILRYHLFKK
jgi:hypothetical protein